MMKLRKALYYPEVYISKYAIKYINKIVEAGSGSLKALYNSDNSLIQIITEDRPKKGPAEDILYENLKFKYDKYLLRDRCIDFSSKYENKKFYPDLILSFEKYILLIEIDEPYDYIDGLPIHYYTEINGKFYTSDYFWNSNLFEKGFNIIRFAEIQVFKHLKECLSFIDYTIECFDSFKLPNIEVFKNKIPKLTEEESIRYSHYNIRDFYLPKNIKAIYKNENAKRIKKIKENLFK